MTSKMGTYLRRLESGPVEIMLRVADFALRVDPAKQIGGSGQELVAFAANSFREIDGDDAWEFEVVERTESGGSRKLRVAVAGEDILMVRVEGRLQ